MSRIALACIMAILCCAVSADAAQPADPVSRMFAWYNQAFKQPGSFTPEAFRQFFTEDATLVLEGREVIHGVDEWAKGFQSQQTQGGEAEIVLPLKMVFRHGDLIYNYHVIRSRQEGKVSCWLAAGHAVLRGDKIASLTLVRVELDPEKGPLDPACWRS